MKCIQSQRRAYRVCNTHTGRQHRKTDGRTALRHGAGAACVGQKTRGNTARGAQPPCRQPCCACCEAQAKHGGVDNQAGGGWQVAGEWRWHGGQKPNGWRGGSKQHCGRTHTSRHALHSGCNRAKKYTCMRVGKHMRLGASSKTATECGGVVVAVGWYSPTMPPCWAHQSGASKLRKRAHMAPIRLKT